MVFEFHHDVLGDMAILLAKLLLVWLAEQAAETQELLSHGAAVSLIHVPEIIYHTPILSSYLSLVHNSLLLALVLFGLP